jgi:hypothetical protein
MHGQLDTSNSRDATNSMVESNSVDATVRTSNIKDTRNRAQGANSWTAVSVGKGYQVNAK